MRRAAVGKEDSGGRKPSENPTGVAEEEALSSGTAVAPQMRVEVSKVVRADRAKVYSAYTDFESTPKWSKQIDSVRVLAREGNTVRIQTAKSVGGRVRLTTAQLVLTPLDRVETESQTRFTNTKRTVTFEDAPEGTKVTATLEVEVKRLWSILLAPRGRQAAESSAREGMDSFAGYVEGLP